MATDHRALLTAAVTAAAPLPMVTGGWIDGASSPAPWHPLRPRERYRVRAGEVFAFRPDDMAAVAPRPSRVNGECWFSVSANDYLDQRRPEYAHEEARGTIVYRRESGQGGRVYLSSDCSSTILEVFATLPALAGSAAAR